jgi:integrase
MSIWDDKQGRKHVGIMVNGKRVHRVLQVGATESDAKLVQAQLRTAIDKAPGKVINIPGDPLLVEVMALYMDHADKLRSPKTAKHHAVRFGPWAEKYRASQTRQAAAAFIKDTKGKYADATINWSLSTLKKALELAYDADKIPVNYADQVKTLKVSNTRDIVLTIDQANKFAELLSDQARAAMWISLYTACRRGEVLKIQKEDIGETTMVIRMGGTKTLKTRTIPIVAPLRPWLAYVPLDITYEGVKSSWRRARTALDLEHMTFHDLRRSCATMMIAAGVDLYVVSKLLGHSSVTVTQQRYGHLQIDRIAAGLEKTFG